ncbi:MAG: histidine phosphatase family protein [Gemmatimonadaceae bacterium]|nr:histidine phosphatase family protein [Acetobacteraceae bacterium]
MRRLASWCFIAVALLAGESARAMTEDAGRPAALVDALRRGGYVVVMRHAATDRTQVDRGDLANRSGQRNLSPAGTVQAAAIGRALDALRIPIGAVLTSPVFRARDTADLAFGPGRATITAELTADDYEPDGGRVMANVAWLQARIGTPPVAGNDILVGHIVPLSMALGWSLRQASYPEGAMAVFRPEGGQGTLLGILTAEDLLASVERR